MSKAKLKYMVKLFCSYKTLGLRICAQKLTEGSKCLRENSKKKTKMPDKKKLKNKLTKIIIN